MAFVIPIHPLVNALTVYLMLFAGLTLAMVLVTWSSTLVLQLYLRKAMKRLYVGESWGWSWARSD